MQRKNTEGIRLFSFGIGDDLPVEDVEPLVARMDAQLERWSAVLARLQAQFDRGGAARGLAEGPAGHPVVGRWVGADDDVAVAAVVGEQRVDVDLQGASAAIQGYGNAGQYAHSLGHEMLGLKVVAVSDSKGGIYCPDGLDPADVLAHKRDTGSVVGFPGARRVSQAELLELDVDLLIPSALENQITGANAGNVKARIIAELANGPTTPEADEILVESGVHVIPDFLCNAGGVTVSYFEQVQNAAAYYWDVETVHERLDTMMTAALHSVYDAAQHYGISTRMGAYIVAVSRVAEACKLRGWV